jgi:hypothetical protein
VSRISDGWRPNKTEGSEDRGKMMRIGIAADHGGFELKVQLTAALKAAGYEVKDFGALELTRPSVSPRKTVLPFSRF